MLEIVISYPEVVPSPIRPRIYRVKHWIEQTDNDRPYGRPEVEPTFPAHFSPFGQAWQLRVMQRNPKISPKRITNIYNWTTWMTNENGFGDESDPRKNYFTGEDMDSPNLPKVENLLGGGTIFTGYDDGLNVVVLPLDYRMVPPSVEWFKKNPWYEVPALNVDANGLPRKFGQGLQPDGSVEMFYHPMIMDTQEFPKITIPASKVQRWTATQLPDPLKIYL